MIEKTKEKNDAYVHRFSFRGFSGKRRGRLYRLFAISWQWWVHEWKKSKAVKVLFWIQIFILVITNLFLLAMKDYILYADPNTTTTQMLENTIIPLVRGLVSFHTEISGGEVNTTGVIMNIGGNSLLVLMLFVLIGSGLIADDITNKTNEIYYSKLAKHEYIIGKFGAFMFAGNILITLPYIIEFFLLFIGLGNIDFLTVLPLLIGIIIFTELVNITFASIMLAFSSLTGRKLYAGLIAFFLFFILNMISPSLAYSESGEAGFPILFDVMTVLLIISFILEGTNSLKLYLLGSEHSINLVDGVGIENWTIIGALLVYIVIALSIVVYQVYRRHSN
ncbi:MAG: hypothetical protein ACTSW1_12115 [Candidatus Hodarchaeales archaeon]